MRRHRDVAARRVRLLALVVAVGVLGAIAAGAPAHASAASDEDAPPSATSWEWPLAAFRLDRPYAAPAHPYGPGHRGVDLQSLGSGEVLAPAAGSVAYSGTVAGRGILTIDHGDGYVATLEPIASELAPGAPVRRGDVVGAIAGGGHARVGTLHFGVRLDGEYVNPLLLFGGIPRAVLLPCC